MSKTIANTSGRGVASGPPASLEAKRRAAMILEVLAGARSPSEASAALGLSTGRYYLMEDQALGGLVSACEPRNKGPSGTPGKELANLHLECEKLRRDCARYQHLARVSQKTIGLPAPPSARAKGKEKGRRRRPMVRALRAAERLQQDQESPTSFGDADVRGTSTGPVDREAGA